VAQPSGSFHLALSGKDRGEIRWIHFSPDERLWTESSRNTTLPRQATKLEPRVREILLLPRIQQGPATSKLVAGLSGSGFSEIDGIVALVGELARHDAYHLVEYLDADLRPDSTGYDKRVEVHLGLRRCAGDPSARDVLSRLAAHRPDSVDLAAYRPGGIDFLVRTLESATEDIARRVRSAWALGATAGVDVLPRLERFKDDSTPYGGYRWALVDTPTLGREVRAAIIRIGLRHGR
jgi:hypothetical protein